ncbi:MAG: CinA domain protein [Ilumatobacteraceae bacterium]|nr:CinA domain protein [Ilumatobacteraceae bacterium]
MSTHERAELDELASVVVRRLGSWSVATAESCTAGRIATSLACVDHAVDFLRGGLVAYQEGQKRRLLGVTAANVVSPTAAAEMATGVARLMDAEVAVATTGVAGNEPEGGVPGGTVFIATVVGGEVGVVEHHFDGSPVEVCELAVVQALRDLLTRLPEGGGG